MCFQNSFRGDSWFLQVQQFRVEKVFSYTCSGGRQMLCRAYSRRVLYQWKKLMGVGHRRGTVFG